MPPHNTVLSPVAADSNASIVAASLISTGLSAAPLPAAAAASASSIVILSVHMDTPPMIPAHLNTVAVVVLRDRLAEEKKRIGLV
ncbi:hypothetical protein Cni_G02596 [Canna indica]|uniref:Uncharacterized protein n=1 Tax=Canna indica TaxID=4628 RepID=A0AAQ3Q2B3_9LILI|nr:hypothetical protein Cni_G02596 [Canna indica]